MPKKKASVTEVEETPEEVPTVDVEPMPSEEPAPEPPVPEHWGSLSGTPNSVPPETFLTTHDLHGFSNPGGNTGHG